MSNPLDLTGQHISDTYERIVQTDSGYFYDGLGNTVSIGSGSQGPQGWQGPRGDLGTGGVQGVQGPQGFQGWQGPQGWQGVTGAQGPQGWQGPQGRQGLAGPQGVQGRQGTIGSTGATGSYRENVEVVQGTDPNVQSGLSGFVGNYKIDSILYDVYRINAKVTIPGGGNVYVNYIGTVGITGSVFRPHSTKGLVDAGDPGGFEQVQSSLTTGALVYDETLLFAAPVDLMTFNYDNTTSPSLYNIFLISANTNNFSCEVFVDYFFYVEQGASVSFLN
jgi:hypothetical protein